MQPGDAVTWIKVPKPVFDLAGVILSALGLTGILAVIALVVGAVFGATLILRRRHEPEGAFAGGISLRLRCPSPLPEGERGRG